MPYLAARNATESVPTGFSDRLSVLTFHSFPLEQNTNTGSIYFQLTHSSSVVSTDSHTAAPCSLLW